MLESHSAGALIPGPVGLKESRVVDNSGQQSREGPEQESREELGNDGILSTSNSVLAGNSFRANVHEVLTFRYSTGLVTLNLSMVEMIIAGVVRKKSRIKRMQLMMKQRIHQEIPPSERCSLQEERSAYQGCDCLDLNFLFLACTSGRSEGREHKRHSSYAHEEPHSTEKTAALVDTGTPEPDTH